MNNPRSLQGKYVQFCIKDVRVPDPAEILAKLHGHDLLQGRVTDLTDSGINAESFAVVEVVELPQPVVVSTRRLTEPG